MIQTLSVFVCGLAIGIIVGLRTGALHRLPPKVPAAFPSDKPVAAKRTDREPESPAFAVDVTVNSPKEWSGQIRSVTAVSRVAGGGYVRDDLEGVVLRANAINPDISIIPESSPLWAESSSIAKGNHLGVAAK